MKQVLTLRARPIREPAALLTRPSITGPSTQRESAQRALEQTRAAIRSGALVAAAANVLKQFESAVAGAPQAGPPGVISVRVAAAAASRAGLPAVPLAKLRISLKLREAVAQQEETNTLGLAFLSLPNEPKGSYQLDVLSPEGAVLATDQGRWTSPQGAPVHLLEVARSDKLKVQLERARPFESAILKARERAKLVQNAAVKALAAQEQRLAAYVHEIDAPVVGLPAQPAADVVVDAGQPAVPVVVKPVRRGDTVKKTAKGMSTSRTKKER